MICQSVGLTKRNPQQEQQPRTRKHCVFTRLFIWVGQLIDTSGVIGQPDQSRDGERWARDRERETEYQVWGLSVGVSVGGDLKWLGFRLPTAEKRRFFFFQRLQYENIPKINDMLGHNEVKGTKSILPRGSLFIPLLLSFALWPRMLSVKGGVTQEAQSTWQPTRELCLSKVAPGVTLNKSQRFISRQLPQGEERRRRREWDFIGWSQNRKHQPLNYGPSSLVLHGWRRKNFIASHPGCYFKKSASNFFPFLGDFNTFGSTSSWLAFFNCWLS